MSGLLTDTKILGPIHDAQYGCAYVLEVDSGVFFNNLFFNLFFC